MAKSWKSLFVKGEEETETQTNNTSTSSPSFPVNTSTIYNTNAAPSFNINTNGTASNALSTEAQEVMEVYEKGLDSINMPGYDFFEFYKAVQMALPYNEQSFNMAYQMAKSMDSTVTVQKLVQDAEFYISKINDVHSQYVTQGQQRLSQISEQRLGEKTNLTKIIDNNAMRIAQLRAELTQLENDMQTKRNALSKIDADFAPKEQAVKSKLNANDIAKANSIAKLNLVRDSITKFIKNI
jgi:hypothetical protein